jgi:AraC-like DNA-binding protein
MERKMSLMKDVLSNFGVKMRIYDCSLSGLADYDDGLRSRLYKTHDTKRLEDFIYSIEPAVLCLMEDPYGCHYCFFPIANIGESEKRYCAIGPWITSESNQDDFRRICEKKQIPYHVKLDLEHFFSCLPTIDFSWSWECMLVTFADYLHDDDRKFRILYRKFDPDEGNADYSPKQDLFLSMQLFEDLYNSEDALLKSIKAGDTKRAMECIANFSYYHPPQRTIEKLRNDKDYLLALNTLIRKAVQQSFVHPIHIHAVSTEFARRIEEAQQYKELLSLSELMIHKYCALIQNHSLAKFSAVVRKVINHVEFNLREPLTLNILAKQFNIDPSNLSHHFTREAGMTLTDYINGKRLEYAKSLLSGSSMYIQEIAEQCGFQTLNYFNRLFRRKYGKTPKEYRNNIHEGI